MASSQRFHIKWKNFSHLHNTDETYEFLKRYKGMKRVDNYIKSTWAVERAFFNNPARTPEETEAFEIEKERRNEWLDGCKTVERVVCDRQSPGSGVEYFCKWKGARLSLSNTKDGLIMLRSCSSAVLRRNLGE